MRHPETYLTVAALHSRARRMQSAEAVTRLALPERAIAAVAEGVDLRVGVVADALHAVGQAVFVGVEVFVAAGHGEGWSSGD